jgi:lipopolysaccharide export system permease protein
MIYIGSRNDRGEVTGLVIDDERDPQRPVTILAERGAFADTGGATRIIMVNGNRQQYERDTGKLSILTFDRYVLDLDMLRDAPEGRFREPQERFLDELLFPSDDVDAATRQAYLVEANERLTVPLSALSFAVIPLACLLPGQFNRRGQLKRVLVAIGCALSFQALDLAVKNLEGRYAAAIALSYIVTLLPLAVGVGILLHRGIRFNFRRIAAVAEATR